MKRQLTTSGDIPSLLVMRRPPSPKPELLSWNRQSLMIGCPLVTVTAPTDARAVLSMNEQPSIRRLLLFARIPALC